MRYLFFLLVIFFTATGLCAQDTTQHIVPGRQNSPEQQRKPYLVIFSADGFRYDYAEKYHASNLLRLRKSGVYAQSMKPSFPSVTYPNHYSVVTGMYPSHHGLVYNEFYDRERKAGYAVSDRRAVEDGTWYGGIPLWVLAEQQHMVTASLHYVATEAPIQGIYPTYWYRYKGPVSIDFRIKTVMDWLRLPEPVRPHLITLYMEETDHAGHVYGTGSPQAKKAVLLVDSMIGRLSDSIKGLHLPVNFIFLSDHGMADVDTVTRINPATLVDTSRFIIRGGNTSLHLYAKAPADIAPAYKTLKQHENGFIAYLREDIPARWHLDKSNDRFNRVGDIFIVPVYPRVLSSWKGKINPGAHGFDNDMPQMHAVFYAWGPQLKKGKKIGSFENVHVYPLACKLLGLEYTHAIDGRLRVLENILR